MTRWTVHLVAAKAARAAGIEFLVDKQMLGHAVGYYLANSCPDRQAIQLNPSYKVLA
jgi:hypothetical protein